MTTVAPVFPDSMPEIDPPVVPCPPAMRGDARRALALRLDRSVEDITACLRIALEAGDEINAARIREGLEHWRSVVAAVGSQPR